LTFIDAIDVSNNINNNKIVISTSYCALIKLLKHEKYCAKKFTAQFFSEPWTLSGLNKLPAVRLLNTGHFTSWGDFTKAPVTIACVSKFNQNLALILAINSALLT